MAARKRTTVGRRDWRRVILPRAVELLAAAPSRWTKRQLWYSLLSEGLIVVHSNAESDNAYRGLCRTSAVWQRAGRMARTIDQGRSIDRDLAFAGPADARRWLHDIYRRHRTEGQPFAIFVGAEKATMREQLRLWFADRGFPRVLTRGYSSQPLADEVVDEINAELAEWGRPAVLVTSVDLDVDGDGILADFERRTNFTKVTRVGINDDHIDGWEATDTREAFEGLRHLSVPAKRKGSDKRRREFRQRHGGFDRAIEIEAMEPERLRALYEEAIADFWDPHAFETVVRMEQEDLADLDGDQ